MRRILVLLAVIGGVMATGVPQAHAATRVFPSAACSLGAGLTGCINGANNGDTIKVRKGLYFENVFVSKDVTIKPTKCDTEHRVTIDAAPPAPPAAGVRGVGFDIGSSGVTIDCIKVRHATSAVKTNSLDNLTVSRLTTLDATIGVDAALNTDNLVVKRSTFTKSTGDAVSFVGGTGLRVLSNRCRAIGSDCIDIDAAVGAIVNANTARQVDDGLVEVSGISTGTQILNNRATEVGGPGIESSGDFTGLVISGNSIQSSDTDGIRVLNANAFTVTNNIVTGHISDDSFDLSCASPCGMGTLVVRGNETTATAPDDGTGYNIEVDIPACGVPPCARIVNNIAKNAQESGFFLTIDFTLFSGNTANLNGASDLGEAVGFLIDGVNSTIQNNVAKANADDGFRVLGDGHLLDSNRATGNVLDGFHVIAGADNNVLNANKATNNEGDGIENDGANTTVTNNVSSGNRTDCAADVAPTTNTGNSCADGSNFTAPGGID